MKKRSDLPTLTVLIFGAITLLYAGFSTVVYLAYGRFKLEETTFEYFSNNQVFLNSMKYLFV